MADIGAKIKEARRATGYTQSLLAKRLGISRRSIQQYESGETEPSPSTLMQMAALFGTTFGYLTDDSPYQSATIPVFDCITSIDGMKKYECVISSEAVPSHWPQNDGSFAIKVKDGSMEPRFYKGDVLLCSPVENIEENTYVVALINGRNGVVRRISLGASNYILTPINPQYKTEIVEKSDCMILGVVKEQRSRF